MQLRYSAWIDNTGYVFAALIVFRIVNALSIKTFFQPDEYFQSLEPAWQITFGENSRAWITWEWRERLRSSMHPYLFAAAYRLTASISEFFNLSGPRRVSLLLVSPKIVQAIIAATGDFYSWQLACRVYGGYSISSRVALALTILSPWQWFCSVRTLSNSLETTLTAVGLTFWPWEWYTQPTTSRSSMTPSAQVLSDLRIALSAAAVACILRPTNLIVWATASATLILSRNDTKNVQTLVKIAIVCGGSVLAVSIAADWQFYGTFTFPPLKFLYFNIVQSLAVFYGRNRPDYYLTEGLPLLLTTTLPFALMGLWQALVVRGSDEHRWLHRTFAAIVISMIGTLSLIDHKEVRFIYPLLPILHLVASESAGRFFNRRSRASSAVGVTMVIVNLVIAGYLGFVHQRGVIDALDFIRISHSAYPDNVRTTVGFLMPCHSTPWRSHLIYPNISAWALTCEPPLNIPLSERSSYLDEADIFYQNPSSWIAENMLGKRDNRAVSPRLPGYLVFFEQLLPELESALKDTHYKECWRGFNTHWHDDWRRQGDVIVWCRP